MSRAFALRQMQLAAYRVKRCPPQDKSHNRDRAMTAIKIYLEGVARDRVDQGKRQG
jgi:hypothetical protein